MSGVSVVKWNPTGEIHLLCGFPVLASDDLPRRYRCEGSCGMIASSVKREAVPADEVAVHECIVVAG